MADWTGAFTYAFRTLRRQPTFVLVSVLTLALGIGANTAIFSVIKTVVLNPLPYEDPEKIAVLWEVNPDGNQGPVSIPTFEDWKREAKSLESLAAYQHVDFSYQGTGDPQNVPGLRATPDLFSVLKSNAVLGRTFTTDEAVPGASRADGVDGCRRLPVADCLRQHGQPVAGAAVEPPARDGRSRRA